MVRQINHLLPNLVSKWFKMSVARSRCNAAVTWEKGYQNKIKDPVFTTSLSKQTFKVMNGTQHQIATHSERTRRRQDSGISVESFMGQFLTSSCASEAYKACPTSLTVIWHTLSPLHFSFYLTLYFPKRVSFCHFPNICGIIWIMTNASILVSLYRFIFIGQNWGCSWPSIRKYLFLE